MTKSWRDKKGESVTLFSDFSTSSEIESLEAFKTRTGSFIWNSLPQEFDLWVSPSVKKKVDFKGEYREFFGNTVVFLLADEVLDYIDRIQQKLEKIREDYKYNQPEAYLADALKKETYHITLHDLINGPDREMIKDEIQYTEKKVLYILNKLKETDYPIIKMEPVCMYNMNSTSVVLGFQPVSEEDHQNLMMLYQLFQTVVELSYPLTPHVTLSYFRYGKHKSEKLSDLRALIQEINTQIDADKKEGKGLVVELDVKHLAYQRFSSMNHYFGKE